MISAVKHIIFALTFAATSLSAVPVEASGFYFPEAVFLRIDSERLLRGDLGVLGRHPASHLFVAYRYLTGQGLNETERKAVDSLWQASVDDWGEQDKWMNDWLAARARIGGLEPPTVQGFSRASDSNPHFWYHNCLADTFRSAIKTLDQRIALFGDNSAEIRQWIQGQDAVLANCWDPKVIPPELPKKSHPVLQADRAYQIAAANFYAGNFEIAEKLFRSIAADPSSSWRQLAPYLVARTLIRRATINHDTPDKNLLRHAEEQLGTVLTNESLKETHPPAKRLLGFVLYRLKPEERLSELGRRLLLAIDAETLKQDLYDYENLLNNPTLRSRNGDDLTDWIITLRDNTGFARENAIEKWRTTRSLHWLVAMMISLEGEHPYATEALKAAAEINSSSAAYPAVLYNRVRILMEQGDKDAARNLLDRQLPKLLRNASPTMANLFRAQRMKVARNLDELLTYAPRRPSMVTNMEEPQQRIFLRRMYFDRDAVDTLNATVPLQILREAARKNNLPEPLRQQLAVATWTRAVLLEDHTVALNAAELLRVFFPNMRQEMQSYIESATAEEKRFVSAYVILKYPGMRPITEAGLGRLAPLNRIDNFRDNWWCNLVKLHDAAAAPAFLNERQKEAAQEEVNRLVHFEGAATYLGQRAIKWSKTHPDDPRVPEALHLTVRATRYGCAASLNTGTVSREAFLLLHKNYPKSEWTKKTPFWYH